MSQTHTSNTDLVPKFYKLAFIASSVAASILFFALIFSFFFNLSYLFSTANQNLSSLTVEASSTREVIAVEVKATVIITRKGSSTSQINTELDLALVKALEILNTNEIDSDQVETNKNVYQDYDFVLPQEQDASNQTETRYRGDLNLTINFKDISLDKTKPNQILEDLNQIQDLQFSGFDYNIQNREETCTELESEALQKAMEKGGKQVAALNGRQIIKTNVLALGGCNNDFFISNKAFPTQDSLAGSTELAPVLPTKNELTASVSVEFQFQY
jgi:hypothetical protein